MLKSSAALSNQSVPPCMSAPLKAAWCTTVLLSRKAQLSQPHLASVLVPRQVFFSDVACHASGKGFGKVENAQPVDRGEPCPCNSGKSWKYCCLPRITGTSPAPTAEAALRARFCAYTKGYPDYIIATTHTDYHAYHYQVEPGTTSDKLAADVANACNKYEYAGLKILKAGAGATPDEAFVEYEYLFRRKEAAATTAAEGDATAAAAGAEDSDSSSTRSWDRTAEKDKFKKVEGGVGWQLAEYQMYTMPDQKSSELVAQAELTSVTPAPAQVKARAAAAAQA